MPPNCQRAAVSRALLEMKNELHARALATLLGLINDNNGVLGEHHVSDVSKMYKIHRNVVNYQLRKHKNANINTSTSLTPNRNIAATEHVITPTSITSPITDASETPTSITMINATTGNAMEVDTNVDYSTSINQTRISRKQKKINEQKQRALILESRTLAAMKYSNAQKSAVGKVAPGTLQNIIANVEIEKKLEPGTILPATIKSRVIRNNLTGYNPQTTPPLLPIEPFLVELCFRMGRMGKSLQKPVILQICSELMRNTEHEKKYRRFIIDKSQKSVVPGNHWYTKFLHRHSEKLSSVSETIMDVNRKTYCVKENFLRMYENIYHQMTEAGVAIKLEKEVMLDKSGEEAFSHEEMFGLATGYIMTRPDNVLFMDETGCNTNKKTVRLVVNVTLYLPTVKNVTTHSIK